MKLTLLPIFAIYAVITLGAVYTGALQQNVDLSALPLRAHAVLFFGGLFVAYAAARITVVLLKFFAGRNPDAADRRAETAADAHIASGGGRISMLGLSKSNDRQDARRARVAAARRRQQMKPEEQKDKQVEPEAENTVLERAKAADATLEERMAARRERVRLSKTKPQ